MEKCVTKLCKVHHKSCWQIFVKYVSKFFGGQRFTTSVAKCRNLRRNPWSLTQAHMPDPEFWICMLWRLWGGPQTWKYIIKKADLGCWCCSCCCDCGSSLRLKVLSNKFIICDTEEVKTASCLWCCSHKLSKPPTWREYCSERQQSLLFLRS